MVGGNPEIGPLADIIFVIEGTAINGAYLNDIKSNYIIPTLEYFCQGTLEERDYIYEGTSALYGIIVYHAADRLPSPSTDIYGPYSNPHKVLQMLDKIELVGGRGESHANVAEALAASLVCLEDLQQRREAGISPQNHCILVCNSPPYLMPVTENQAFAGNTAEQLAAIFTERNVHLSILSPRKIPALFKLYEKAGGDLTASQTKNYAKDPRHLVLLKGFSLKERPVSPTATHNIGVASLSSPLPSGQGSPMPAGPQPPPPQANQAQPIIQGSAGGGAGGGRGFVQGATAYNVRPPSRWPMLPPQQRLPPPGSALIEQLTRPPTAIVTPFNSSPGMNPTTVLSQQQQQQQQQHAAAAAVAAQQQQQQAAAAVAAAQQQQQQQMRIAQGVMQSQQGVMSQPQQQGILNQQQTVMGQQTMLGGNQQMGQTVIGQPQQPNQVLGQNQQPNQQQVPTMPRERHTIWQGILEWIEKTKNPSDPQKLTRSVPCQVSANSKDGEPELKADSWPQKLIMQLMPKQLIGNIGGPYLKNSKSVLFHPTTCEALDSLTKVLSSGFAGCVHFPSTPSACDIKVLILLYSPEKRAYLGFIPNDQTAFVDRLRKVIQQQKTTGLTRQPQAGAQGGQGMAMQGAAGQPAPQQQAPTRGSLLQQSTIPQQQQQQTLNTGMAAAGVGQPGGPILSNMQPDTSQQQNPQGSGQPGYNNHMVEAARQENLVKIQRLWQTLEAAQQQEIQYKNQLELTNLLCNSGSLNIMNHMKIQQMQDNLQPTQQQQQEIQYKAQLEQEQQIQLRAQLQQIQQQQQQQGPPQGGQQPNQQQVQGIALQAQAAGQQRMMRPAGISNNPGLRHLLQQPQYRMNMQQQMPRAGLPSGPGQNNQPQQFDDVNSYDFLN